MALGGELNYVASVVRRYSMERLGIRDSVGGLLCRGCMWACAAMLNALGRRES